MTPETYKEAMEKLTVRDKDLLSKVLMDDWSRWEPPTATKSVPKLISTGTIYACKWGVAKSWRVWIRLDGGDFVLAGLEAGRFFPLRMMYDHAVVVMRAGEAEPVPPEILYENFLRAPPDDDDVISAFLARKQQAPLNKMGDAVRLRGVPARELGQVWRTPSKTEFELVEKHNNGTWVGRNTKTGAKEYSVEEEFEAGYYTFVRDAIRWEDYLPMIVTPKGMTNDEDVKEGQVYASRWTIDTDHVRLWCVTLEGDVVLAGMSEEAVFGNRFTPNKSVRLNYDRAVLIADVGQPPQKFVKPQTLPLERLQPASTTSIVPASTEVTADGEVTRHVDINSRYPAEARGGSERGSERGSEGGSERGLERGSEGGSAGPFVDARRAALEKKIADAETVPTCIICGARGPTGKSRMCFGCWGQSRGATEAALKKPERFVVDVCDEDLLPPA